MNILHINTLDNAGGAAKVAYRIHNILKKEGYTSNIFVGKKYTSDKDIFLIQKPNILFKWIKLITKKDPARYLNEKINNLFPTDIDFFNIKNLYNSQEYKNADIIHCHNLHGGFFNLSALKKISKKKIVIWTLHDMWAITYRPAHAFEGKIKNGFFECPETNNISTNKKWKNKTYLMFRKRNIYNKINFYLVVPSKWLKSKIKQSILKDSPISLIYNGIDNNIFKPYDKDKTREELNLPKNKKIITFLAYKGKDNPWKGWEYTKKIINHYKDNNDILFLCIGGDNEEKNDNTIFINFIQNEKLLAKYYSASDILLFTSIAENFPLVLLEAMSCGLPIVTFDVGGVKEAVLHKKNGYIAQYKNTDDLLVGVNYIFNLNANEYKIMRKDSRERVTKYFSLQDMVNNYKNLYLELLNKKYGK